VCRVLRPPVNTVTLKCQGFEFAPLARILTELASFPRKIEPSPSSNSIELESDCNRLGSSIAAADAFYQRLTTQVAGHSKVVSA
jgi:hypothetical protein